MDPIDFLQGTEIEGGWRVSEKLVKAANATGGHFSVGYHADNQDGRKAFVKFLDFRKGATSADPARDLQLMISAYNFERDVLEICRNSRMDHVVVAIGSGFLRKTGVPYDGYFYLIFELAEGDVNRQLLVTTKSDICWSMCVMHHISVGLSQLHLKGISHQDIKPSNVLVFDSGKMSKLADLGRAHCVNLQAPHDDVTLPGAILYAPPEQLYGWHYPDRNISRRAADMYMLGSMLYFLVCSVAITPAIAREIREEHKPTRLSRNAAAWRGTFEEVLPFLRNAYGIAIAQFELDLATILPNYSPLAGDIVEILKMLTDPDPRQRGHHLNRRYPNSDQFGIERFVSSFDLLSKKLSRIK